MVDVIWATLGVVGWLLGVLVLVVMALFPALERRAARRGPRAGADR